MSKVKTLIEIEAEVTKQFEHAYRESQDRMSTSAPEAMSSGDKPSLEHQEGEDSDQSYAAKATK